MPDPVLPDVRPGQIISASFVNQLIAKLTDLERRVVDLEVIGSTGTVLITGFQPSVQQLVGQTLAISGMAFAFPPSQNLVTVDSVPVQEFDAGSNTTKLVFRIPPVMGEVPGDGRNVVIEVRNANGSVRRLYHVLPAAPAEGEPPVITAVSRADGALGPLKPDTDAIIDGEHFSSKPSENVIRLQFNPGGGAEDVNIPRPDDPPVSVLTATETQLKFRVPAMPELPLGQAKTLTVRVRVGAQEGFGFNSRVVRT